MITFWWALGAMDGMGVLSTLERISGAEKSRTLWVNAHACLKTLYPKTDEHGPGLIITFVPNFSRIKTAPFG